MGDFTLVPVVARTCPLQELVRVVSRRSTSLNQAWAWADIIRLLTEDFPLVNSPRAFPEYLWLHDEMTWVCEDLVEAGAWPVECPLEVDLTCGDNVEWIPALLRQLEAVTIIGREGRTTLVEVKTRAHACLSALQVSTSGPAPLEGGPTAQAVAPGVLLVAA